MSVVSQLTLSARLLQLPLAYTDAVVAERYRFCRLFVFFKFPDRSVNQMISR